MLTDEELDSLAKAVFDQAFDRARSLGAMYLYDVDARRATFYGAPEFRFSILSLPTIKRIIRQCEELLLRENLSDHSSALRFLADITVTHLIRTMGVRVADAIDDAIGDCAVMAEAMIGGHPEVAKRDVRPLINSAARAAAEKKRSLLLSRLGQLPNLKASGPGRPSVTRAERDEQRRLTVTAIQSAFVELRGRLGRRPTQKEVAEAVGYGGTDPGGAEDTREDRLRNRLTSLSLKYSDIISQL